MKNEQLEKQYDQLWQYAEQETRPNVRSYVCGKDEDLNPVRTRYLMNGTHVIHYDTRTHDAIVQNGQIIVYPKNQPIN